MMAPPACTIIAKNLLRRDDVSFFGLEIYGGGGSFVEWNHYGHQHIRFCFFLSDLL
jgi:hypothetical protein